MSVLPNDEKRRRAFIDELCLLKDMDEYELEYLHEMEDKGERIFWEALHDVCGVWSREYILQIAEKSVEMVEYGYKEIEEKQDGVVMEWGDIVLVMIQWHMVGVCALELAKYEKQELYREVKICVEQTKGYLRSVIESRTHGIVWQEDERTKRQKALV